MKTDKFIIIYDTYCGWCYGAAPLFDALVETGAVVEVLHRNLFREPNAQKLSEGKGALILEADAKIAELTGQFFSQPYFDNVVLSKDEILDSTYTAHAAALVHEQGAVKEFSLRKRLEEKRFIGGVSAQDRDSVIDVLIEEGVPEKNAQKIGTKPLIDASNTIAERARQLMHKVGSVGVPTVLKYSANTLEVINHSAYYGRPDDIKKLVAKPLADAS